MCNGGSAPRSTIAVPDYEAYDRMAERQMALMETRQNRKTLKKQGALDQAIANQQQALSELLNAEQQRAQQTAADAQRMAALIGTPPPEPTAKAPVIGDSRTGMAPGDGKKSLRINRKSSTSTAARGAGLNIGGY